MQRLAMTNHSRLSILSHRNMKWLFLCLLLGVGAFLLWPSSALQETNIFIPVDYSQIPTGLTITGPQLKGIEVNVRGPKSAIGALSDLKIRYMLDLSGVNVGVESIPINKDRIPFPERISIISIKPPFLTIRVENEIEKELPVEISFSGKPAAGFLVAGGVAKPLSVILKGSENILGPMEKVLTKPVDLKGLSESFKKEIALDLPEDLEIIAPSGIILAEIFIEERIVTRTFYDILVNDKDSPYVCSITPPSIKIEVKGPVNIIEKLHPEKGIKVYVDLKGLKPGVYVRRAAITLPVKTTLIGVKPEIFTVKISSRKK